MDKKTVLHDIVKNLRESLKNGPLGKQRLLDAIDALRNIGYKYKRETYPELMETGNFTNDSGNSPGNLSEALLWKLGKWKAYKTFASQYKNMNALPKNSDVVFFAFAKHLVDQRNPIYDQHVLRAMWAICGNLTNDDHKKCEKFLIDDEGNWKDTGSGETAVACYNIFVEQIRKMVGADENTEDLDMLLMPLGQALKKVSKNYTGFSEICEFHNADYH